MLASSPGTCDTTVVSGGGDEPQFSLDSILCGLCNSMGNCKGAEVFVDAKCGSASDIEGALLWVKRTNRVKRTVERRTSRGVGGDSAMVADDSRQQFGFKITIFDDPLFLVPSTNLHNSPQSTPVQSYLLYFFLNLSTRSPFFRRSTFRGLRHRRGSKSNTLPIISLAK
jgi:hypothetical protein